MRVMSVNHRDGKKELTLMRRELMDKPEQSGI